MSEIEEYAIGSDLYLQFNSTSAYMARIQNLIQGTVDHSESGVAYLFFSLAFEMIILSNYIFSSLQ